VGSNPEIGLSIAANGIDTNYHDQGSGEPVLMIHGSGPGVTAFANWRLTIPSVRQARSIRCRTGWIMRWVCWMR